MPAEGLAWMPRTDLLSFEEIARIVRVLAPMGIRKLRLTGGEPTVRKDLEGLIRLLAAIPGIEDLSMTTNGHLFAKKADAFAQAGLKRVNVSLDTLDPVQFAALTRGGDLGRVLSAIDAARAAGLSPIKINAVVMRGESEDQVMRMVETFSSHASDTVLRFIEYMPFGKGAKRKHWPAAEIRAHLATRYSLVAEGGSRHGGPATAWRVAETGLRLGFISPITDHFCDACNRLRLMADGHLRTCLSRDDTPSLRDLVRAGASDEVLAGALREMVWGKVAGHEAHAEQFRPFEGVMTAIGG